MATNTLLQYLQSTDGDGVALGITPSNRRQVERFIASSAIAAGDIVALDITKTADGDKSLFVVKADTSKGETTLTIGVALEAAEADAELNVVIRGLVKDANVASGGAVGDRIVGSGTAGRATQYAAGSSQAVLGYQMAAAAANKADVFIIKQF
tara:strand:+ start:1981 stop:2439 length:459 start_codon:yes stop_codon:yes gene_type:complete